MRNRSLALAIAMAIAAVSTQPAFASCDATIRQPVAEDAASPLQRQFAGLIAADRFSDAAGQAERWRAFLKLAEKEPGLDPAILIRARTWLAWALDYSDQVEQANVEIRKALQLVKQHGLLESAMGIDALIVASTVQTDSQDIDGAARSAAQSLDLAERLFGSRSSEASIAHNALGTVAYAQGHYIEAERRFGLSAALAVACLPANDPLVVNQLASHAGTLYMVGKVEEALVEGQRAANWGLSNLPESNPTITLALGNLGTLFSATGRYAEAETALRKVVDLEGTYQSESWFYRAISLSNYANVLFKLGRNEEAEALWLASLDFHQKASIKRDPITPAFPLRFAADAAQARGDIALALARREQAVAMIDAAAPEDNPERARTHLEHALTLLLADRSAEALAEATPAIAIVRTKYEEADTRRFSAEIGYARILYRNDRLKEAYELGSRFAALAEKRLLDASASRGDLVRWGPSFASSFSAMTEIALANGKPDEAFRYLQLANLSDVVLVSSEVAARAAASDPRTADKIRELQDRIRRRQTLDRERSFALGASDSARVSAIAADIAANDAAIARTGAEIDQLAPQFRNLGRPTPVSLADYQAGLAVNERLVAPLALDDALLAITVTREGLTWSRSPATRPQVQTWVRAIRKSIDNVLSGQAGTGFAFAEARSLYRALLPDPVPANAHLIYYASGPLATIPPSLLIASDIPAAEEGGIDPKTVDWLVRHHPVTIAAALAPRAPDADREQRTETFLGIGAPDLSANVQDARFAGLPTLPGAASELTRIAGSFRTVDSRVLSGPDATEDAVRKLDLARYSVIAFATHGLTGGERPGLDEPALVLTPPGMASGGNDGLLTASEIMQLRLNARWVILSACNSASGETGEGQALSGIASAFMHAGARSLLVSHWPVRDDVAAQLVKDTVRANARGISEAEALQRAQLRLIDERGIRDAANPALWAPLVPVR